MTHPARTLVTAYLAALVCFLAMDACWLSLMGPRFYAPALGPLMAPEVGWLAAVLFYPAYIAGLIYFAVLPALESGQSGAALQALRRGSLLGLLAYATYDLTNQSTLLGWPWAVTGVDMAWGGVVSGAASYASARITLRFTSPSTSRPASRTSSP